MARRARGRDSATHRRHHGFKAYYLLKTGDGTPTISVFDDRAGAEESNRAAAAWIAENLPDLNIAPANVTPGEAVVNF
jgi:hypothetical protein